MLSSIQLGFSWVLFKIHKLILRLHSHSGNCGRRSACASHVEGMREERRGGQKSVGSEDRDRVSEKSSKIVPSARHFPQCLRHLLKMRTIALRLRPRARPIYGGKPRMELAYWGSENSDLFHSRNSDHPGQGNARL